MRYLQVPSATFTDWNGASWSVKEMREVPMSFAPGQRTPKFMQATLLAVLKTIPTQGVSTMLDEIASRVDVYGADAESNAYLIFDMNADAIASNSFDLANVKTLVLPRKDEG